MKKYIGVFSLFFFHTVITLAQRVSSLPDSKQPINFEAIQKWPTLGAAAIDDNGTYIAYNVYNQPAGGSTLIVKDISNLWHKEFVFKDFSSTFFFSSENKKIIYLKNDSLFFQTLGKDESAYIVSVNSYKIPQNSKVQWLAYKLNNINNEVVLLNLLTGSEQRFSSIAKFSFDAVGSTLLLEKTFTNDSVYTRALQLVNLEDGHLVTIWSSQASTDKDMVVSSYNFDAKGEQLVFMIQDKKIEREKNSIWYYNTGIKKASLLIDDHTSGIDSGFIVDNYPPQFSKNGKNIFFKIHLSENRTLNSDAVDVDIWSYKDVFLQTEQLNDKFSQNLLVTFVASLNLLDNRVIRLETEKERMVMGVGNTTTDYVVIANKQNVPWWKKELEQQSYFLISLKDNSRQFLKKGTTQYFSFSPLGKYLVYFDGKTRNYFSYNMTSGSTKNISWAIPVRLDNEHMYTYYVPGRTYPLTFSIAGWLHEDSALLIYDNYDIWKLDPTGSKPPESITRGYGRRHHITFNLAFEEEARQGMLGKDGLLLTAFNHMNKHNGFYRKYLEQKGDPELLTMGPYLLYRPDPSTSDAFDQGMKPLKAGDSNAWIVKRQTTSEAPNYFFTKDFKEFTALSNLQPQKKYNWLTTELITWKQLDGNLSQGILYKPEDFDPHKKYPVIFHYYEKFSFRLYEFPHPDYSEGRIDIPWFVSRGYLVFTPDIHYSVAIVSGKTVGDCVVNSVVSAAQYLSKLPYVDGSRMGIQGHSFSGGETLSLITRSKMFAAACAAASTVSDEVSAYLRIKSVNGKPIGPFRLAHAETGRDHIGATLWQRPDLYIKCSPVLLAHRVTTPLLMMHNMGDVAVDWGQSIEMYMALRRLDKKVWMLQYDGEDHTLSGKSAIDYTLRMTQFFDHYLKGALPPHWMTKGIPARLKRIETGYELDASGEKP